MAIGWVFERSSKSYQRVPTRGHTAMFMTPETSQGNVARSQKSVAPRVWVVRACKQQRLRLPNVRLFAQPLPSLLWRTHQAMNKVPTVLQREHVPVRRKFPGPSRNANVRLHRKVLSNEPVSP